jgi:hypothetical protein
MRQLGGRVSGPEGPRAGGSLDHSNSNVWSIVLSGGPPALDEGLVGGQAVAAHDFADGGGVRWGGLTAAIARK